MFVKFARIIEIGLAGNILDVINPLLVSRIAERDWWIQGGHRTGDGEDRITDVLFDVLDFLLLLSVEMEESEISKMKRSIETVNLKIQATYSSENPLTCSILICLTMVLLPDSPAPSSSNRWVALEGIEIV